MPEHHAPIVRLSELVPREEATCFALLVRKQTRMTKNGKPFVTCTFRDATTTREAKLWHGTPWIEQSETWEEGQAFRLRVELDDKGYGPELALKDIRPAGDSDRAIGYVPEELYPSPIRSADECWTALRQFIETEVDDPFVRTLITKVLDDNHERFRVIQAATSMHHAYVSGLLEHVWSMTRIGVFLSNHYARYYVDLDPPISRSIIIAATVLHDIGKLLELEYRPANARYTKAGYLLGHIVLGRDLVRDAARGIEGFPDETLLLIEHAILSHHRSKQFGSPVEPQTIEALIVSFIDELDAKVNSVAIERLKPRLNDQDCWTDKLFTFDNRRFYRGLPRDAADEQAGRNGQTDVAGTV